MPTKATAAQTGVRLPAQHNKPTPKLRPPTIIGNRKFYSKRDYREFVAACAAQPVPLPQPDDEDLITAAQLRAKLGNVSDMWLHRHTARDARQDATETAAA
jgi:hypothetical protein